MRHRTRPTPRSGGLFHTIFGAVNTRGRAGVWPRHSNGRGPTSGRTGSSDRAGRFRYNRATPVTLRREHPLDALLADLIDQILRFTWSVNPTAATAMGIHDHDHRLVDCSPEALD